MKLKNIYVAAITMKSLCPAISFTSFCSKIYNHVSRENFIPKVTWQNSLKWKNKMKTLQIIARVIKYWKEKTNFRIT